MTGKILAQRYEIHELLGEGGMASVYKAQDLRLQRPVAIKILKPHLLKDPKAIERFKQEATLAGRLHHPNIAEIYDLDISEDCYFIAMEFVEGSNLKQLLKANPRMDLDAALKIFRSLLPALAFAHGQNMVHRDLKPQNIMITKSGEVKITDFGIAKIFASEGITQDGEVLGSVNYLSPEQAQAKEVSYSTDIYALGIMLFEMLTGKLPFEAENAVATVLKQVQQPPPDPRELNPEIPESLAQIILTCLEKDPAKRYSTVVDLEKALQTSGAISDAGLDATLIAPKEALAPPPPRSKNSAPKIAWIGWTALVILSVGILLYLLSSGVTKVTVPSLVGKNIQEAQSLSAAAGLKLQILKQSFSSSFAEGIIMLQQPAAGELLRKNGSIIVTVSKGEETLELPNLEGMTKEKAMQALNTIGLQMLIEQEIYSDKLPPNVVITQTPPGGSKVTPGSVVKLILSAGMGVDLVPDLRGLRLEEAQLILKYTKFNLKILSTKPSALYDKNVIMEQEPPAGNQSLTNLDIKVVICRGLEGLTIPQFEGKSLAEAKAYARANGFELAIQSQEQSPESQIVKQEPETDDPATGKVVKVWCEQSIVVPNLVGKSLEEAHMLLQQAGLTAGEQKFQEVTDGAPADIILEQNPVAGVEISPDNKVDLVISKHVKP